MTTTLETSLMNIEDEAGTLQGRASTLVMPTTSVVNGRVRVLGFTSSQTFYASTHGAKLDSNPITGGGTDDTLAIQALLDIALLGKPIHIIIDGAARVGPLNIYSMTTLEILPGGGLYLKNSANRAMLRNGNPTIGTPVDHDITLIGGIYNGNSVNQTGTGTFGTQEASGTLLGAIQFYGVTRLRIYGIHVMHSKTIAVHVSNASNVGVLELSLDNKVVGQVQQGGLQFDGPCSQLHVNGLRGATEDDMLALNTNDADWSTGLGPYITNGDIKGVAASNIVSDGCNYIIRTFNGANRLDDVVISNVTGTCNMRVLHNDPLTIGPGNIGKLVLSDVSVRPATAPFAGAAFIDLYGRAEQVIINNFNVSELIDARPLVNLNPSADIEHLEINGLGIDERSTSSAGIIPVSVSGRVHRLIANDWNWNRDRFLPRETDFLKMLTANSQIEELSGKGWRANRVNRFINQDTGRIGSVNIDNVQMEDAAGGVGVRITTATNDVYMGGWRGVYAVPMTGVAITKRGDAFPRDTTAPTVSSFYANGGAPFIVVTFNDVINASNLANGITIKKNTVTQTITSAKRRDYDPKTVEFVLSANVALGDTVTWEYDATAGDYQDLSGNLLATVTPQSITPARSAYVYELFEGVAYGTAANGRTPAPLSPGHNWATLTGSGGRQTICGGKLLLDGSDGSSQAIVVDSGGSNIIFYATVWVERYPTVNTVAGLIFRLTDASNYWAYLLSYNMATLYKVAAGVVTSTQTALVTFTRVPYLITVVANGNSISCNSSGAGIVTVTDSFNSTATKCGVRGDGTIVGADDLTIISAP